MLTQVELSEIQYFQVFVNQISAVLTAEGNATSPLITAGNITLLNSTLGLYLDYLDSIIPVPAP